MVPREPERYHLLKRLNYTVSKAWSFEKTRKQLEQSYPRLLWQQRENMEKGKVTYL